MTTTTLFAADPPPLIAPEHRLAPDDPAWRELAAQFARQSDLTAEFEERRVFPFRREPVVLAGTARISETRGLSLHYPGPEARTVIIDARGMLVRDARGDSTPPADSRAGAANAALLHILRLDFGALAESFELYGRREAGAWSLALVPRAEAARRAMGDIFVEGTAAAVRRIEIRRSARQHITIAIGAPLPAGPFSESELKQYFR